MTKTRCPTCDSGSPERHPAVQYGGEVEICTDDFHLQRTPANRQTFIEMVLAKRAALESARQEASS